MHHYEVSVHRTAQKNKAVTFPHLYAFLVNSASENVLPLLPPRVILLSYSPTRPWNTKWLLIPLDFRLGPGILLAILTVAAIQ